MGIIIAIIVILIVIALIKVLFESLIDFLKEHKWVTYLAIFIITIFVFPPLCTIELIIFSLIWVYRKVKSNANNSFQKRAKELAESIRVSNEKHFIDMCWNDKILRSNYNIINTKDKEDKEAFIVLLKPIIYEVAGKRITEFLMQTVRLYGAFTYEEILNYAANNTEVTGFSNYKSIIDAKIYSLVMSGKLLKHPIGENETLYENATPMGKKMKSTVIEM